MCAAATAAAFFRATPALTARINNAPTRRLTFLVTQQQRYCAHYYPKLNPSTTPSSSLRWSCPSSSSTGYGDSSASDDEQGPAEEDYTIPNKKEYQQSKTKGLWKQWREKSAEMSSKLAKLGLSAVLAYGLFDAVTYTSFFVLAFLGYEKSTGKNPAANLKALIGIVILMWTGNNVTRPFRVAGAAALAPVIDKGLKRIQKYFNFPSLFYAFALVVGIVAAPCLVVVGILILSRLGK